MKLNFRIIAKFVLLLVVIGFLMPVSFKTNGFGLAYWMFGYMPVSALFLYLVFIASVAGIIIGVLLAQGKNPPPVFDWICIIVSIVSGIIVLFSLDGKGGMQIGSYMILLGWILSLGLQIKSVVKADTFNQKEFEK